MRATAASRRRARGPPAGLYPRRDGRRLHERAPAKPASARHPRADFVPEGRRGYSSPSIVGVPLKSLRTLAAFAAIAAAALTLSACNPAPTDPASATVPAEPPALTAAKT